MKNNICKILCLTCGCAAWIGACTSLAATENEDTAENYGTTWINGSNQGGGFEAWKIIEEADDGTVVYGVWDSSSVGLEMGDAFGMIACGENSSLYATRMFSQTMADGDVFRFDMGLNYASGTEGERGFLLKDASGVTILKITHDSTDRLILNDTEIFTDFTLGTMHWTFVQISVDKVMFYVTGNSSETFTDVLNLENSRWIAGISFYAIGAMSDTYVEGCGLFFDNFSLSQGTAGTSLFTYSIENSRAYISKASTNASGNIVVPAKLGGYAVGSVGRSAFKDCTNITSISFADQASVTNIGPMAFQGCTSLAVAILPSGLDHIPQGLFYGCEQLISAIIPDGVTTIGDAAFAHCRQLSAINFPAGLVALGESVFLNCRNLKTLDWPEAITVIPGQICYECRGISELELPATISEIRYNAFYNCCGLDYIHFLGDAPALESASAITENPIYPFENCTATAYYEEATTNWDSIFGGLTTAIWGNVPDSEEISLQFVWNGDQLVLIYVGNLQSTSDWINWETLGSARSETGYHVSIGDGSCFYRVVGD